MEAASKNQFEVKLATETTAQAIRDRRISGPYSGFGRSGPRDFGGVPIEDYQEQTDGQTDIVRDVENIFASLANLGPVLTAEQKELLQKSNALMRGKKIVENAKQAGELLKQTNAQPAAVNQEKVALELADLARALRTPRDKLDVLREARDRLDDTIKKQNELREETAKVPESTRNRRGVDPKPQHAREMAAKESRNEFDTKQTHDLLKDTAKDAADAVKPAEQELHKAVEELRKATTDFKTPIEQQEKAADALKEARKTVDDLIAKEEKKRTDPLEAVNAAKEKVEELIKDQTKTKEATEATKGTQKEKLPAIAKDQKELDQTHRRGEKLAAAR